MKTLKMLVGTFFVTTWLVMCVYSISQLTKTSNELTFGPLDVVRRVSAPNGDRTAILVRSYGSFFDLNFVLYISDERYADISDCTSDALFITDDELANLDDKACWIKQALWISRDYEPTTNHNWYEDVVWSRDGLIIAVTIEDHYIFAYDIETEQRYEHEEQIKKLISLHGE